MTKGKEVPPNVGGKLIIRRPWPSMLRTIYGDKARYKKQYWSEYQGQLLHRRRRAPRQGWLFLDRGPDRRRAQRRRPSPRHLGSRKRARESRRPSRKPPSVGRPGRAQGPGRGRFRHAQRRRRSHTELKEELRDHVGKQIGAIAKPDEIRFAEALPKTRSGKIMRRLLKEIASGKTVTGDTTTLEDFSVLAKLAAPRNNRA